MVTAAKVQQAQASKDAQAAMAASTSAGAPSGPSHEATYVSGGSTSSRQAFRTRMEYESSQASSEEAEVPMSFGEQLVLETYLRFRGRRYDRQRQEELSQPRRIKPPADHWTGGRGRKVLEKEQLDDMLKRLAEPKRGKATDSGELIALHSSKQEIVKQRVQAKDVEATFARLSAPKTGKGYDPSPGEKVCLMYNQASGRNVNLERLADMAKPKKRGGAPDSWAVTAMAQKVTRQGLLPAIPAQTLNRGPVAQPDEEVRSPPTKDSESGQPKEEEESNGREENAALDAPPAECRELPAAEAAEASHEREGGSVSAGAPKPAEEEEGNEGHPVEEKHTSSEVQPDAAESAEKLEGRVHVEDTGPKDTADGSAEMGETPETVALAAEAGERSTADTAVPAGTDLETSIENPPLVPGNGASSSSGGEQGPASASDDVLLVARKLSRDFRRT